MALQQAISAAWYQGRWWWRLYYPLLLPLSWLFTRLAQKRRLEQTQQAPPLPVPVIVVGNIAVGGTGKTPVIIALVKYLQAKGLKPGVISRGYGAKAPQYPFNITAETSPAEAGDEPLLIVQSCDCPVVIDPNRVAAAEKLLADHSCNVILSDDGLQHYRLPRQFELCVLDAQRGLGNGRCLPAGPLREAPSRLTEVDLLVCNGEKRLLQRKLNEAMPDEAAGNVAALVAMVLKPTRWVNLQTGQVSPVYSGVGEALLPPWEATDDRVVAISGIGNPQRFFETLQQLGVQSENHAYDDHHAYRAEELQNWGSRPLVMTAKDAVKCRAFAQPNWWYLEVEAEFEHSFSEHLDRFVVSYCQ